MELEKILNSLTEYIKEKQGFVLTLPTEEEVFGFNAKERQIVDLLKKCEIHGNYIGSTLDIFQQCGRHCEVTDLVGLLGGDPNEILTISRETGIGSSSYILTYSDEKLPRGIGLTDKEGVIRPILRIPEEININSLDDLSKIEYGEYPQSVASPEMQQKLELEFNKNSWNLTWLKQYYCLEFGLDTDIDPLSFQVFEYEGKKYIRVPVELDSFSEKTKISNYGNKFLFIEVLPITWILDKKDRLLMTEKGLISHISFVRDFTRSYYGPSEFGGSQVYDFLHKYFLPNMLQSLKKSKDYNFEQESQGQRGM